MDLGEREWHGSSPVCVLVVSEGGGQTVIDVDEPLWHQVHADLMRAVGTWHLLTKDGSLVFSQVVLDGEQPYYTARHIGRIGLGQGEINEILAYGIGKKRRDGHVDRLWMLETGQVCGGDDVDMFGRAALLARQAK